MDRTAQINAITGPQSDMFAALKASDDATVVVVAADARLDAANKAFTLAHSKVQQWGGATPQDYLAFYVASVELASAEAEQSSAFAASTVARAAFNDIHKPWMVACQGLQGNPGAVEKV